MDTPNIKAALERVGADKGECPVCGTDGWLIAPEPVLWPLQQVATPHTDAPPGTFALDGAEVAFTLCSGCGFMRTFHVEALLRD